MGTFARIVLWLLGMLLGLLSSPWAQAVKPMVAAGDSHSLALSVEGQVYAWGDDSYGQLGLGRVQATDLQVVPGIHLGSGLARSRLAAGEGYSLVIQSDGSLWAWGKNSDGQLGDGTQIDRSTPQKIGTGFRSVAAGWLHTIALKSDGSVWAWGTNMRGELGRSPLGRITTGPTIIRGLTMQTSPMLVSALSDIVAVAAGNACSLALKADGTVWAWGSNHAGQLGDGTSTDHYWPVQVANLTQVVSFSAGSLHTLAVKSDGTVWAWGSNHAGQLGDGTTTDRSFPVQVRGLTGVVAVAAGAVHSLALKQDGTLWAWGANFAGQLGDGTWTDRSLPVRVASLTQVSSLVAGRWHTLAVKSDGSVWAWGENGKEGLLGDGTRTNRSSPVQVRGLTGVVAVEAGSFHSLALKQDGTLWAWGSDSNGQLGRGAILGHVLPAVVPGLSGVVAVAAGYYHSLAVQSNGSVWAWGWNSGGQLGDGTTTDRSSPVQVPGLSGVVAVAAGFCHSLALKSDGSVWAWGWNSGSQLGDGGGQLGDGTTTDRSSPVQVQGLTGVVAVAAGFAHSLALKSDGSVWAWGRNDQMQLGDGTQTSRSSPVRVANLGAVTAIAAAARNSVGVKQDGSLWLWGGELWIGDLYHRYPTPVSGIGTVRAVASGSYHFLALTQDGTLWALGWNDRGQLGDGTTDSSIKPAPVPSLGQVSGIAAGSYYSLALKPDGTISAWGANDHGQLGDGTLMWSMPTPTKAVNPSATGLLSLTPSIPIDPASQLLTFFLIAQKNGNDLKSTLTDPRFQGLNGAIYFTALLPSNSPLLPGGGHRAGSVGTVPVAFQRSGVKQTGPTIPADSHTSGTLTAGSEYTVYEKSATDPLANSDAVICMGITTPPMSAKGQVLMRPIATGEQVSGVVQCPPVQTEATIRMYTGQASGPITSRTIVAQINPLDEDRGQVRQIFSWAVAPDRRQFMQTPQGWLPMTQPMPAVMTLTVPRSGPITVPVITGADLSALAGTLAFIGMGSSWKEVEGSNKAGHYYTVQ